MPSNEDDFRVAFETFDKDGGGDLSVDELRALLKALGMDLTEAETQDFLNEVDDDASGTVTFDEFMILMNRNEKSQQEEMEEAWAMLDTNGDGSLDKDELRTGLRNIGVLLGPYELRDMVAQADKDGDGHIDKSEFMAVYGSLLWQRVSGAATVAADMRDTWTQLDSDDSGTITVDELKEYLEGAFEVSDQEMASMLKDADFGDDGEVEFSEFARAWHLPQWERVRVKGKALSRLENFKQQQDRMYTVLMKEEREMSGMSAQAREVQMMRRGLRRNPEVFGALQKFWNALDDLQIVGTWLVESTYCGVSARLSLVVDPELQWDDGMTLAKETWEEESAWVDDYNRNLMGEKEFLDGIFRMADFMVSVAESTDIKVDVDHSIVRMLVTLHRLFDAVFKATDDGYKWVGEPAPTDPWQADHTGSMWLPDSLLGQWSAEERRNFNNMSVEYRKTFITQELAHQKLLDDISLLLSRFGNYEGEATGNSRAEAEMASKIAARERKAQEDAKKKEEEMQQRNSSSLGAADSLLDARRRDMHLEVEAEEEDADVAAVNEAEAETTELEQEQSAIKKAIQQATLIAVRLKSDKREDEALKIEAMMESMSKQKAALAARQERLMQEAEEGRRRLAQRAAEKAEEERVARVAALAASAQRQIAEVSAALQAQLEREFEQYGVTHDCFKMKKLAKEAANEVLTSATKVKSLTNAVGVSLGAELNKLLTGGAASTIETTEAAATGARVLLRNIPGSIDEAAAVTKAVCDLEKELRGTAIAGWKSQLSQSMQASNESTKQALIGVIKLPLESGIEGGEQTQRLAQLGAECCAEDIDSAAMEVRALSSSTSGESGETAGCTTGIEVDADSGSMKVGLRPDKHKLTVLAQELSRAADAHWQAQVVRQEYSVREAKSQDVGQVSELIELGKREGFPISKELRQLVEIGPGCPLEDIEAAATSTHMLAQKLGEETDSHAKEAVEMMEQQLRKTASSGWNLHASKKVQAARVFRQKAWSAFDEINTIVEEQGLSLQEDIAASMTGLNDSEAKPEAILGAANRVQDWLHSLENSDQAKLEGHIGVLENALHCSIHANSDAQHSLRYARIQSSKLKALEIAAEVTISVDATGFPVGTELEHLTRMGAEASVEDFETAALKISELSEQLGNSGWEEAQSEATQLHNVLELLARDMRQHQERQADRNKEAVAREKEQLERQQRLHAMELEARRAALAQAEQQAALERERQAAAAAAAPTAAAATTAAPVAAASTVAAVAHREREETGSQEAIQEAVPEHSLPKGVSASRFKSLCDAGLIERSLSEADEIAAALFGLQKPELGSLFPPQQTQAEDSQPTLIVKGSIFAGVREKCKKRSSQKRTLQQALQQQEKRATKSPSSQAPALGEIQARLMADEVWNSRYSTPLSPNQPPVPWELRLLQPKPEMIPRNDQPARWLPLDSRQLPWSPNRPGRARLENLECSASCPPRLYPHDNGLTAELFRKRHYLTQELPQHNPTLPSLRPRGLSRGRHPPQRARHASFSQTQPLPRYHVRDQVEFIPAPEIDDSWAEHVGTQLEWLSRRSHRRGPRRRHQLI